MGRLVWHAEVVAGVGPTSILGGAWESAAEGRSKDLRELFRQARGPAGPNASSGLL